MILEAFPELSDEESELFLPEYKARLQSANIPDADGLIHMRFHGFLIFGEKIWLIYVVREEAFKKYFRYCNIVKTMN